MTGWELIEGIWLEKAIERQFADGSAAYMQKPAALFLNPPPFSPPSRLP
jgi:hypothetical protein